MKPSSAPPSVDPVVNPQKARKGIKRLAFATTYSLAGLKAGWGESAFRQEVLASIVLIPASFWLGRSWIEISLLAGSVVFLMIVELLNTAIESVVDRVGPEWHELSKRAKDMGSAAVLLALLLVGGIWLSALFQRFTQT